MPAPSPRIGERLEKVLRHLGQKIRDRRKSLKLSATITAESAGMSRVTLYRVEKGEASVAMGAYLSAITALGLELELVDPRTRKLGHSASRQRIPDPICLADYAQLKRLAWQLKSTTEISPKEALELYERNWRHVDLSAMNSKEKELLENLLITFGRERLLV